MICSAKVRTKDSEHWRLVCANIKLTELVAAMFGKDGDYYTTTTQTLDRMGLMTQDALQLTCD